LFLIDITLEFGFGCGLEIISPEKLQQKTYKNLKKSMKNHNEKAV
jgi:hypothetical protein